MLDELLSHAFDAAMLPSVFSTAHPLSRLPHFHPHALHRINSPSHATHVPRDLCCSLPVENTAHRRLYPPSNLAHYRSTPKNKAIVDDAEKLLNEFKPMTINAHVEAKETETKIDEKLKELQATLASTGETCPFEDEVHSRIVEAVETMIKISHLIADALHRARLTSSVTFAALMGREHGLLTSPPTSPTPRTPHFLRPPSRATHVVRDFCCSLFIAEAGGTARRAGCSLDSHLSLFTIPYNLFALFLCLVLHDL